MGVGGFADGIVLHQLLQWHHPCSTAPGWGVFNVLEGLINHQLLGIHHVRDDLGGPLAWDLGFLGISVVIAVAGWLLYRRGRASGNPGQAAA
jgi:uncharacterized membrane protein